MSDAQNSFAQKLKTAREKAGLSQYALAKLSGLSKQALSNLELGNREPSWETVQRLVGALGVSCEVFSDPDLKQGPEVKSAKTLEKPAKVGGDRKPAQPKVKGRGKQ